MEILLNLNVKEIESSKKRKIKKELEQKGLKGRFEKLIVLGKQEPIVQARIVPKDESLLKKCEVVNIPKEEIREIFLKYDLPTCV